MAMALKSSTPSHQLHRLMTKPLRSKLQQGFFNIYFAVQFVSACCSVYVKITGHVLSSLLPHDMSSVLSFYHGGANGQELGAHRLGSKHFYLLSHFTGPSIQSLKDAA